MELDPRKPFAENIASGLQGLALRTTFFLYVVAIVILVPVSMVTARILGQRTPTYLIPVLVSLFVIVAYLYSWRLIFKRGPKHLLLYVGPLAAISYAVYWLPPGFIDQNWLHFDIVRRSALWLVRGTAFRSLVGPLALLGVCFFFYWLTIRKRWYIVVSEFRVWGNLGKKFPPAGVAALMRDELMRLAEMANKTPESEETRSVQALEPEYQLPTIGPGIKTALSLPETHVTLQYNGVSIEALQAFVRRFTGREVAITGDALSYSDGLLLSARSTREGPWEVFVNQDDGRGLTEGLRKLALRVFTTYVQQFLSDEGNAFLFLQFKALDLGEYDLALRLAQLARESASDEDGADRNLAAVHIARGVWLSEQGKYMEAIQEYKHAADSFSASWQAWHNLGIAYQVIGEIEASLESFKKAHEIEKENT